jgi:integrase
MLAILVAARTQEVRGAKWDEFELHVDIPIWVVPGDRMKSGREHRVPLAEPVLELLDTLPRFSSGFLFEGRPGKPLSENAMLSVLKRMGRSDITVHGFRSTFRDWCAEQTAFPREIAETALAHVNKDRVEAAYLRSDLLRRRYKLMQRWAKYATTPSHTAVVKLPVASSD